jgi:hypothetical protein
VETKYVVTPVNSAKAPAITRADEMAKTRIKVKILAADAFQSGFAVEKIFIDATNH